MICRWCKGTGAECGCGEGHCAHCGGSGNVAAPPFGTQLRNVLPAAEVSRLAESWCSRDRQLADDLAWGALAEEIARSALGDHRELKNGDAYQVMAPGVVEAFFHYWMHPYRDETLGAVIQRMAQYAADHPDELVTRFWADSLFMDEALARIQAMSRDDLIASLTKHGIAFEDRGQKGTSA